MAVQNTMLLKAHHLGSTIMVKGCGEPGTILGTSFEYEGHYIVGFDSKDGHTVKWIRPDEILELSDITEKLKDPTYLRSLASKIVENGI
jgi:hypothetical protein